MLTRGLSSLVRGAGSAPRLSGYGSSWSFRSTLNKQIQKHSATQPRRLFSSKYPKDLPREQRWKLQATVDGNTSQKNANVGLYLAGMAVAALGLSYLSVPLYRIFCEATGYGGYVKENAVDNTFLEKIKTFDEDDDESNSRLVSIKFSTDLGNHLNWRFETCQDNILVRVGESALAFFRAKNLSHEPIIGVATYNVSPPKAGLYFNKVQCFCFDEQRLIGDEEIDMPVFFFLDPEFAEDPRMEDVNTITLSYTFFPSMSSEDEDDVEEDDDEDVVEAKK